MGAGARNHELRFRRAVGITALRQSRSFIRCGNGIAISNADPAHERHFPLARTSCVGLLVAPVLGRRGNRVETFHKQKGGEENRGLRGSACAQATARQVTRMGERNPRIRLRRAAFAAKLRRNNWRMEDGMIASRATGLSNRKSKIAIRKSEAADPAATTTKASEARAFTRASR